MLDRLPKYLLFGSLALLLLGALQFLVGLVVGRLGDGGLGFDLVVNSWRYPLVGVVLVCAAIVAAVSSASLRVGA